MAIVFDTSNSAQFTTSGTDISCGITVGAGSNRALVVGVSMYPMSANISVSYSGTSDSITQISHYADPGGQGDLWVYLILNPQTGSQTVTITADAARTNRRSFVGSYNGVNQSTSVDNTNTNTTNGVGSTSYTQSVTVNTANSWLVWMLEDGNNLALTAGANTTIRQTKEASALADSNSAQSTGSQSMNVTSSSQAYAGILISLSPAAATPIKNTLTFSRQAIKRASFF